MSQWIRILLIVGSIVTFFGLLYFIRKFKFQTKHATIWIAISLFFVVLSWFPEIVVLLANKLGFISSINLVFIIVIFVLILVVFYLTLGISVMEEKHKIMSFEIASLKKEVDEIKDEFKKMNP